jgi:predicted PurR-regulated permease PerM
MTPTSTNVREWIRPLLSAAVLFCGVAVAGYLVFEMVRGFVIPLLLASIAAVLLAPVYRKLCGTTRLRRWSVAALLTGGSILLVLGPAGGIGWAGYAEYRRTLRSLNGPTDSDAPTLSKAYPSLDTAIGKLARQLDQPEPQLRSRIRQLGADLEQMLYARTAEFVGTIPTVLIGACMFVVALFFFLVDGEELLTGLTNLLPIDRLTSYVLQREFAQVCRGLVMATVLAAFAQALVFGLGLLLLDWGFQIGLGGWVFLLACACFVGGCIPFFGAVGVWAPTAFLLLLNGHAWAAVLLTLWGSLVVSQLDNVIRMIVLQDLANMHPLVSLVSVLGGVQSMGMAGVFLGPLAAAVLVTLLRIFKKQVEGSRPPRTNEKTTSPPS